MYLLKPFLAGAFAGAGAFKLLLTLLLGFSAQLPSAIQSPTGHDILNAATAFITVSAGVALAWNVRSQRHARMKKA